MSDDMPTARGPRVAKGQRRQGSVESIYKGAWMRSLFEVQFAKQLDARDIAWAYEPERLKGGRYLVDFYLPELKVWVEVKGRFEARDELLLPLVAGHLRQERGERLFLYMKTRAYRVGIKGFAPLGHAEFWDALQASPEGDDDEPSGSPDPLDLPDRGEARPRRRPWQGD
jgi:hypothetical protein